MREPLLLPLAAIATGILISQSCQFSSSEVFFCLTTFAILALFAHLRNSATWLIWINVFLACTTAGILTDVQHRPGPAPELDAASNEVVILSGCVVEPTVFTDDREHFVLELSPGARTRVSLSLRPGEEPPRLHYGQNVEIEAKARPPRNFANPGAFDYVRYLARQNIFWTASARAGTPVTILKGRCGSRLVSLVFQLREAALDRLDLLYPGNAYASGMMDGILIGESSRLEKPWTEHFRTTGTYHALVISGLHVTVLAGVLLFLLRLCLLGEVTALAIAAAGAWVFAAVSGWSAPVIRAAAGFTFYLVGRYFFRRGRVLNLLAAIGIFYLLYDPGQLFDASFQLSFFSVAAIGAFGIPLLEASSGPYRDAGRDLPDVGRDARMPPHSSALRVELRLLGETVALWTPISARFSLPVLGAVVRFCLWAYEMVLISAVVQVALALPMALYFHRIPLTGLSANLIIVPLLTLVVPVGFAAIFTGWSWLSAIALVMLRVSESVAAWHAHLERLPRIPDPPLWLGITISLSLVGTAMLLRTRSRFRLPALGSMLLLFGVLIAAPFPPDLQRGTLELTAIDVGQGDSLLVVLPDGRTMLVDTGGIMAFGRRTKPKIDIGEDVVSPYLWNRGIHRLDVIAITHAHEDHIGGLLALLENFKPGQLWTGATPETPQWLAIEQRAEALGIPVVKRHAGETVGAISILAPVTGYEAGASARNNDSLAMRITYGEHSFLLMGDMEKQIEYRLVADQAITPATVLKVAHHGSKTSSTEEFLDASRPALAIISAGFENMFRHPNPEILERLERHHASVVRTDQSGLITVRTDGRRLTISHPTHDLSRLGFDPDLPPH